MKPILVTTALLAATLLAVILTAWTNSVYMVGLLCVLGVLSIVWAAMQADWGRVRGLWRAIVRQKEI
jgi:hypothetical protein